MSICAVRLAGTLPFRPRGFTGNDEFRSRDGFADLNVCDAGADTVTADTLDTNSPECETVNLPPTAGGGDSSGGGGSTGGGTTTIPLVVPPAAANPADGVTLVSSATVDSKGAATIGTIANPPTASATATLRGILPAKLATAAAKKKRKAKPVTVAVGQGSAAAGATANLTVRLGAKARKLIKKRSLRVTATVVARGADGANATVTRSITLKRAKRARK